MVPKLCDGAHIVRTAGGLVHARQHGVTAGFNTEEHALASRPGHEFVEATLGRIPVESLPPTAAQLFTVGDARPGRR